MSADAGDDLRARMAQLIDRELIERAGARLAVEETAEPASAGGDAPATVETWLQKDVWQIAARALRMAEEEVDPRENLANLGIDSIAITEIMVQISRHFGISVAPTTFFEARHLDDLSEILHQRFHAAIEEHYSRQENTATPEDIPATAAGANDSEDAAIDPPAETGRWAMERKWLDRHRKAASGNRAGGHGASNTKTGRHPSPVPAEPDSAITPAKTTDTANAPIAILAMEGRFPKSPDLDTFADHLKRGDDCIEEVPRDRWDWREVFGDPKKGAFTDVKYGGFVPDVDLFDAAFFNISPREAELMDPQHRLFMECVWNLVEKGGYAPGSLSGRKVALFLGINLLDYTNMANRAGVMDAQQLTGLGHAFCPNRLSFLLDIHGPSEVIDTACSSSLVAIHRGVMSIRHEGCEMAIAGGSNLMLSPLQHIMFSKVGMITPDGRCKTFSKEANGYARADGTGAVLLKRLDLAERDGDPIVGVIRGSVEHHGGGATSLTAPNPKAQARLIVEAHRQAGIDPRSIGLIECHGTGTPLGDPVEVEGLKLAFSELYRDRDLSLPANPTTGLGSVKSNIGHAETAAGVAGLIKVLLAMQAETRYRTLHCAVPNPLLDLTDSPFFLLQDASPWKRAVIDGKEQPLRAGLSSFGAGGANVHLVIEEYKAAAQPLRDPVEMPVIVPVSAKSQEALTSNVSRIRHAARHGDLADIAYTLQVGRDALRVRAAFVATSPADLDAKMDAFLAGDAGAAVTGVVPPGRRDGDDILDPAGKIPGDIADHWVSGGVVDWASLYGAAVPRRIGLPGYGFQRKRYWLPESENASPKVKAHGGLEATLDVPGRYVLRLTGKEAFLADHKVAGKPVLPGVAYLELARRAAIREGIADPEIRQVVWLVPLVVESPLDVACEIEQLANGGARVEVVSEGPDGRRVHAQMRIRSGTETGGRNIDLQSLRQQASRHLPAEDVYAAFGMMGLNYGPAHRVITDLALLGDGAALEKRILAELALAPVLVESLSDFDLHPSLLDGALQSAIGFALDEAGPGPGTAALPFSVEQVSVHGACEEHMWALVSVDGATSGSLRKMDIDLIGPDGSVRVSIRGFVTRALESADEGNVFRFEPVLERLAQDTGGKPDARRIVLLSSGLTNANGLDLRVPNCSYVVLDDAGDGDLSRKYLNLSRQLLRLLQKELEVGGVLVQLVLPGGELNAPLAGLGAMLRSIHREHPGIRGQVITVRKDIDHGSLGSLLEKASAAPAGANLVADGRDLLMEVWKQCAGRLDGNRSPWRDNGVYLITGGTGKLGQILAGDVLEQAPGATVVLVSRSPPDPVTAARLDAHPGLHHLCVDIADEQAVAALVDGIRHEHGRLDGVVHAAGVLRDEGLARKTAEQLDTVLGPKVLGAEALDRAVGGARLDFFVLFSSISGIVGNPGQADYAAANAFLDGFAQAREIRRLKGQCQGRTVSIAWPLWRNGGMELSGGQTELMLRTTGLAPLETRQGLKAFYGALNTDASRILVATGNETKISRFIASTWENGSGAGARAAKQPAGAEAPPGASRTASVGLPALSRLVLSALIEEASAQLKVAASDLESDVELTEYGFDSIAFTQFANRLNDRFDLEIIPPLFFEYPTLDGLAGYLAEAQTAAISTALGVNLAEPSEAPAQLESRTDDAILPVRVHEERQSGHSHLAGHDEPVAIIGMTCQFPGAPDVEAFWTVLSEGRDCITEIPAERWNWRDYWGDPLSEPGKGNVKWGGFIEGMAAFDAAFFEISAPEARMMDPQQRLLLTQTWRLMEDAGYAPSSLAGSQTGVFIGTADTGYSRLISKAGVGIEGYSMTGLAPSLGPNRISYTYNLHGPSISVETACSSALVAVHRALEAIRSGHCSGAIAGGINALLLPEAFVGFSKAGMLSPEGHCKPFSATADGYVRGEGVGLVFLKKLADAERDGDRILAVIRASAENHGGHAASLTAPNPKAQAELLKSAYRRAGFDPRTVGYIEAHGTGTPLGDPIEMEALNSAFADLTREAEADLGPAPQQSCAIGSVKSNIGHLELAAGIAGLIKVLLQIRHGEIVRTLHCDTLNPYLKLEGGPFRVAQTGSNWAPATGADGRAVPRRAGVSSFGFGGSNAHIVLEEYAASRTVALAGTGPNEAEIIVLSAKTEAQLAETATRLLSYLEDMDTAASLGDIAYTLLVAREPMEHRLGFVAKTRQEMADRLRAFLKGEPGVSVHFGQVKPNRETISILEDDDPLRQAVNELAGRGRTDDLLKLWVRGFQVDWTADGHRPRRQRISLPGYPFATTEYWVGGVGGNANKPDGSLGLDASVEDGPEARETVFGQTGNAGNASPSAEPVSRPSQIPLDLEARQARTLETVIDIAARTLEVAPSALDTEAELGDFGFDSISMTAFASKINAELALSLTPADFFEFATLSRLAGHISGILPDGHFGSAGDEETVVAATPAAPLRSSDDRIAENLDPPNPVAPRQSDRDDPIAIVGISCRFPMAKDADAYWENLVAGRDCISLVPEDRWSWQEIDGDPLKTPGKTNIHSGGFIDGVFEFDPLFFGISPREARLMDPQQRLMLMHAWKAIEESGHSPKSLAGQKVGVFVGTSSSGYREMISGETGGAGYVATGTVPSVGPNRISYFLDLHGPSEPVETACSSSLVALHRAVQAIGSGECDMAVVGGVNTIITPEAHINFATAGMLSPDGRCKTFSARANGYGRGEGVGMLFLRRLSDAEKDRDPIRAVVRGSAINHGGRANSLTAPNTQAQTDLLKDAYTRAGVDPRTIGYLEAHGTGTELGDPVEINALKSAFRDLPAGEDRLDYGKCWLGSAKTNIGHLELAAGVAGVIKVLKQFEHRRIAPSLHGLPVNPYINFADSPFEVVQSELPWQPVRTADGEPLPLRAGVSSFGFGGVNAHVILEEYVPREISSRRDTHPTGPYVFVFSGRTGDRLEEIVRDLVCELKTGRIGDSEIYDLAYTLQIGRAEQGNRLAVVAANIRELADRLEAFLSGAASPAGILTGKVADPRSGRSGLTASATPEEIAAHWVAGGKVDWSSCGYSEGKRLRLPTYPFAREVYRIEGNGAAPGAGDGVFSRTLDAEAFYLRDHRILGNRILPGAMSLELVRQAIACHNPSRSRTLVLSNVIWQRPVELNSGYLDVKVPLFDTGEGTWAFRLCAANAEDQSFMRGDASFAPDPATVPPVLDVADIRRRCQTLHDVDYLYASYAALGIDYGPSFRALAEVHSGDGEVLARLQLPPAASGQGGDFGLNPSLVDGAFQAAMVVFAGNDPQKLAVPFFIDRVEVHDRVPDRALAHLSRRAGGSSGTEKLDISIADENGAVCVRITGFTLRSMTVQAEPETRPETRDPADKAMQSRAAERYFVDLVSRETEIDASVISVDAPLEDYGIDSVMIMRLTEALEADFGPLSKTLFYEHQTLKSLIGYFRMEKPERLEELTRSGSRDVSPAAPAIAASATGRKRLPSDEPIAIIGLAGRYPGSKTVEAFWESLASGRDSVTEVPADRWDHSRYYDPLPKPGKTTSKWGGFVDGHDRFDPLFFNIAPREAQFMDPQERLFLQCAWETLEDAGYTRTTVAPGPEGLSGGNVGVFAGVMYEEYQLYGPERRAAGQQIALTGNPASIANRVSYFCNFHGPSIAVDSMCSSSLTAIHLACDSLRSGSCTVALAGGVNLTPHPNKYIALSQGRFLSSKGRCESFGAGGDGYVPSEGVGAVLLKPLSRARADGDRIHAVILGSALNHGGKTNGYTVPNPAAQTSVIETAMGRAGVSAADVTYVEAHGTGTSLGDPIEVAALTKAYRSTGASQNSCAIGSVKSNIGHGESAAGIAGLTKILLQMRHGQLAPSLHADTLNPNIAFETSPFRVQRHLGTWRTPEEGGTPLPRIAGLSSFGAGGSNAHLVISEYTGEQQASNHGGLAIYPFSARDSGRLQALLENMLRALPDIDEASLSSVAYTLQEGREAFEQRVAIVARSKDDLIAKLKQALAGQVDGDQVFRASASSGAGDADLSAGLASVARAWTKGVFVDWAVLRQGDRPSPISLPTYPFAEDLCWLPEFDAHAVPDVLEETVETDLPLLLAPCWNERVAENTAGAGQKRLVIVCGNPGTDLAPGSSKGATEVVALEAADGPIDRRYDYYAIQLLKQIQDWVKRNREETVVQVVASGTGEELLLEGLSGLLRCARLEHPKLACQFVAIHGGLADKGERLEADALCAKTQNDIRYEAGKRLVRSWSELAGHRDGTASPWRENGVYLLTGGAGGIGLHVAEAIARCGVRPTLWLTGRSAPKPDATARFEAIGKLGATIHYRQVDVADAAAVAALLREIDADNGDLNGVFHGAGLTRDGALVGKSAGTLSEVLAPKVTGTRVLDDAIGARPLDFLALFASAAGALGNVAQGDYAAANAFMDSYAAWRNGLVAKGARQGRTIAIDWPYWRDGGMKMPDKVAEAIERDVGAKPLTTEAALSALDAILSGRPQDQVLVLAGDHDRLRRMFSSHVQPEVQVAAQPLTTSPQVRRSEPEPVSLDRERVLTAVKSCFSNVLGIPSDRLTLHDPIDRFGVDSVSSLEIVEMLEEDFGPQPATLLFEVQTIDRLVDHLRNRNRTGAAGDTEPPSSGAAHVSRPHPETYGEETGTSQRPDIAIIAVAGRYPGADTIEAFADNLRQGRDCITEIPEDRQDLLPRYSPRKGEPGTSYCKWGGFISDVDRFDAGFFGYTPRMADLADPQERLFLETSWHLLERAGHTRAHLAERYGKRVGVFVGAMYNQYASLAEDPETRKLLALQSYSSIANRTSFFFDLQGPSTAVDSMCSSGLQAVHLACQSLLSGESRLAIAGGVNLTIHPAKYESLSGAALLGSHSSSRAFSGGDGYLPAEGVGAVLLKPLSEARRDGDRVLAVIKGSLANHSGHSAGYAVPNVDAQSQLYQDAFAAAGVDPSTIGYIEAAATGADLADTIELRSLSQLFSGMPRDQAPVALGSVKTNIGHAEAASGLAQLTKVLLQFEHREIFPSLGLNSPRAAEYFSGTPLSPQTELVPWRAHNIDGIPQPKRAMISAFGAGGSNVHLILEEPPGDVPAIAHKGDFRKRVFPVSARTEEQLFQLRTSLAEFVRNAEDLSLEALSQTLRFGRERFDHNIDIIATGPGELAEKLADPAYRETEKLAFLPPAEAGWRNGLTETLPGYPFAGERHWLPEKLASDADTAFKVEAAADPDDLPVQSEAGQSALDLIRQTVSAETGLQLEVVLPDTDLESLGLDSMARMRLIYAVEEKYGIVLTVPDLQVNSTPQALSAFLEAKSTAAPQERSVAEPVPQPVDDGTEQYRCPLGEAQKGLWVLQTLYPESCAYNVPLAFRCRSLDPDALTQALELLCQQYPILGTRVLDSADGPELVARGDRTVYRPVNIPKEFEVEDYLRQRLLRPFDLQQSVFRVEHLSGGTLEADETILLLTAHHIITDGVSSAVLNRHFWEAYSHFSIAEPLPALLSGNSVDYRDFAAWETELVNSPEGAVQKRYWLDKLTGALPEIRLPTSKGKPKSETTNPQFQQIRLPKGLTERLNLAAKKRGVGAAAFYLSAFATVLYRYTGETDLIVGVPSLRRPARRFEETIGYCANMMALRLTVDPVRSFGVLAEAVQEELVEALGHSSYPFSAIARDLGGTATGETPYQVTFSYQNFASREVEQALFKRGNVRFLPEIRQLDGGRFGIEIQDDPDGGLVAASYDGDCFVRATVERLLGHLMQVLNAAADDCEATVVRLPILSRPEVDRALHHWSGTSRSRAPDTPVHEVILDRCRQSPQAIAVSAEGKDLTYKELAASSRKMSLAVQKRGIKSGDRVCVFLHREPDAIAALLAVISLGAVWVPVDPDFPDERVNAILKDAGARVVLSRGALCERVRKLGADQVEVIDLDRERYGLRSRLSPLPRADIDPADTAYILYTSGSTGSPKGVVVSHRALSEHCQVIATEYGLTDGDVVLQFASTAVDTALEQILPSLAAGARLLLRPVDLQSASAFFRFLKDGAVTVADVPPAYLHEVLLSWERSGLDPAKLALRLIVVGGEALTGELVSVWNRSSLSRKRLVNAYGPTEATVTALVHTVKSGIQEQTVPIGRPLPGTEVYILDRDGNLVPDGVLGELHIGGDRLASGYHGRTDLTDVKFRSHVFEHKTLRLYATGDLACFRPNSGGVVEFHGRIDDQVKIRGHRIELGEVEAALAGLGLAEVAVLLDRSGPDGPMLTAYIGMEDQTVDIDFLKSRIRELLPTVMVPSAWVIQDSLPKTVSGKIDRRALPFTSPKKNMTGTPRVGSGDRLEEKLHELWTTVLGRSDAEPDLDLQDDFSAAGGHSLLAVRLLGAIEQAFGCKFSASDLKTANTIATQASLLRQRGVEAPADVRGEQPTLSEEPDLLVPLKLPEPDIDGNEVPPLFLVHPVGGMVSCYQAFAEAAPENRAVYGLRAEGLVPGEDCQGVSVEGLAKRYCKAIMKVQPTGPYWLGGWSFGGVVAYEMAQQLVDAGHAVGLAGLIDSYTSAELQGYEAGAARGNADPVLRRDAAFLADLFGAQTGISPDQDVVEVALSLPQLSSVLPGADRNQIERLHKIFARYMEAFSGYTPAPARFPVVLIRAAGHDGNKSVGQFGELAGKGVKVHVVGASHYSVLQSRFLGEWAPEFYDLLSGGKSLETRTTQGLAQQPLAGE